MVQRYTISASSIRNVVRDDGVVQYEAQLIPAKGTPDSYGEWVKFDDHIDAMAEAGKIIADLKEQLELAGEQLAGEDL